MSTEEKLTAAPVTEESTNQTATPPENEEVTVFKTIDEVQSTIKEDVLKACAGTFTTKEQVEQILKASLKNLHQTVVKTTVSKPVDQPKVKVDEQEQSLKD